MGLSIYNIKKWSKMLTGNSIMHVNQGMGQCFTPGKIQGYFNDLTEKVLKDPETLKKGEIPITSDEKAGNVYFPIAIFQYGLGAYDLFLQTGKNAYLSQFKKCVEWGMKNQETNGAWNNFGFIQPEAPYSSMCQGEGASLLIRAYIQTQKEEYLYAAQKAIDFMLLPLEKGGTAQFEDDGFILYEYTNKPCVLNGWIFSLFGLYDLSLILNDEKYKILLQKGLRTIREHLQNFDCGYWSYYDEGGLITSSFYHNLHIAQLSALSVIDNHNIYCHYKEKFENYRSNKIYKNKAFIKKALQKLVEK